MTGAAIVAQCPGALALAPAASIVARGSQGRVIGRYTSQVAQLRLLEDDIGEALDLSFFNGESGALASFARRIGTLHWRSPKLRRQAQATVAAFTRAAEPPDLCAEITGWVASGYRELPRGDRTTAQAAGAEGGLVGWVDRFVVERGTTAERRLLRRIKALGVTAGRRLGGLEELEEKVKATLGLSTPSEPEGKVVEIGRGTTAAGTHFVARVSPAIKLCLPELQITETAGRLVSGTEIDGCVLGPIASPERSVHCETGLLKVTARLSAQASSVVLLLSDGRQIVSPALAIPASVAGAPGAFYYQVVRGPQPIPISLTELDAGGRTLTTLPLPTVRSCSLR
ncbi:MAG TPA: hypothetical protein VGI52_07715 [Solirubrobacteraceae bacterium]